MMTYNTGNPVGSVDVKDLYDNAQNLDHLVNDRTVTEYPDRLGNARKSWWGMEQDFNAFLLNSQFEYPPLNYIDGTPLTVLRATQLVQRAGQLYRVRLPASFPVNLTGTWVTDEPLLTATSDAALRQDLASPSPNTVGAAVIGRGIQCVGSVTALRALLKTTPSQFAFLTGYYAQGDGGGGLYWLDAADSTSVDNGGTIIVATDGGRWKLADTKNVTVKQFGAKGDGSTNDTARIQAAINWAGTFATAFGYTLLFPRGDYLYSSLAMDKGHVKLQGFGDVRLIKTTATNAGLVIGGQASRIYGNGVTGISFSSNVVGTSGAAVHAINCGQMAFEDVTITNFPAPPYNGVLLENVTQATFNDFSATQCINEGFAASDCVDVYVDTSRSDANGGNGFAFRTVSGLYLSQCTAWNNALQGYLIENTVVTPIAANGNLFHFYTNCIADTSGQHNWLIKNLGSSQMTGCWGSSQRVGAANTWCGIAISSCNGLDLNGCVALNNNSDGLLILNSSIDIKVNGGRFAHNGVGAGASSRYGVHIGAGCEVVLDSASMTDYAAGTGPDPKYQTYGLKVDGSVAALTVTSCNMAGNLTGPYVFDSTPTYFAESLNRTGETTEIASANIVNLPMFGSVFGITGTTTINGLTAQWNGRRVTLITRAACTIADTGTLRLAGNFVGAANGALSLVGDGSGWYETSRSLN